MPVNSIDILNAGKNVLTSGTDEAHQRLLISRFYYSAYHASIEFQKNLSSPGTDRADCGDHANLLHKLNHPTIPKDDPKYAQSLEMAIYLKKLLFNRRVADYDVNQTINNRNVEIVMNETENIFEITHP